MEGEGEINKCDRLEDQVDGRDYSSNGAETVDPSSGLDAPHEQPGEEDRNHEEHAQEHMVRNGPAVRCKSQQSVGAHERAGNAIHNLDAMLSKNPIQVCVDNLAVS